MKAKKKRRQRRRKQRGGSGYGPALMIKQRKRRKQKDGVVPLAAAVPALIAVRKAIGLGATGGAASYGGQKAMQALFKKTKKRKR